MSGYSKKVSIVLAMLVSLFSVHSSAAIEAGIGCINCVGKSANPLNQGSMEFASNIGNSIPSAGNRIQKTKWVDPENNIEDPMNEIVEIRYFKNDKFVGTGTFLKDCRIITALHVLLSMTNGKDMNHLENSNESLIGEKFDFLTNPLVGVDGKTQKVRGSFVVLGHGKPLGKDSTENVEEDWVVGYDEKCLSDKLKLGYVIPINGQRLDAMKTRDYITAGHSVLEAAKDEFGNYSLYIDPKCNVTDQEHVSDAYIVTTCSMWRGGSGQLLLTPAKKKGVIQKGVGGYPQKLAHGIFQSITPFVDLNTPNIEGASTIAAFTYDVWNKIFPFLEGPVDTEKLAQVAAARHQTAAANLSARRQQ